MIYLRGKGIQDINKEICEKYYDDKDLKDEIIRVMDEFGREKNLMGFELPKKIYLVKEPFSIDNQIMTPTMKLRRHFAKKFFEKQINELYEE